jgi:FkbH-like protein
MDSLRRGLVSGGRGDGSGPSGSNEDFLEKAEAELTLNYDKQPLDPRALELINKTNQFNLNGKRQTEATLRRYLQSPDAFLLVASYKDKFGPLGKIAVLLGRHQEKELVIDGWVMSCRAFSRRIEHRCLEELFSRFGVEEIVLDFVPTPRNEPFRSFLEGIFQQEVSPASRLSKEHFLEKRPKTFHRVQEIRNG